jgi:hypothetical protein
MSTTRCEPCSSCELVTADVTPLCDTAVRWTATTVGCWRLEDKTGHRRAVAGRGRTVRAIGGRRGPTPGAADGRRPPRSAAGRREHMRAVAVRVGEYLRRTVGYGGVFTIDGILTRDGSAPPS